MIARLDGTFPKFTRKKDSRDIGCTSLLEEVVVDLVERFAVPDQKTHDCGECEESRNKFGVYTGRTAEFEQLMARGDF